MDPIWSMGVVERYFISKYYVPYAVCYKANFYGSRNPQNDDKEWILSLIHTTHVWLI